jgi:hypothetical protein
MGSADAGDVNARAASDLPNRGESDELVQESHSPDVPGIAPIGPRSGHDDRNDS